MTHRASDNQSNHHAMRVSIVLAAFNEARGIEATLDSIQKQTHHDWELIVVDDCSTDGTDKILAEWSASEPRLRVLRNRTNDGLARSLNRGWQAATGDLIARIDGDDVMMPERLARQFAFMHEHPEVDVVGSACLLMNSEGVECGQSARSSDHDQIVRNIYRQSPFIHPSVMMRRSFLERCKGYDERLRRSQDYDLWLRGHRTSRYANLPEALIRYRVRPSISWPTILYGGYTIFRATLHNRQPHLAFWHPPRFCLAATLSRWRLRAVRLG